MTRQEFTQNFVESVERERVCMGLTQAQMADKLGMSISGYKKMIAGETNKIGLHLAYLMYSLTGKWLFELCGELSGEMQMLQKYRTLNETQKHFIDGIVDFEAAFAPQPGKDAEDYVTMMIPTGNVEDGMLWDSVDLVKIDVSAYRQRFGDKLHCAIKITSNHLHPVYHMGDILLICQRPPRDGDTGIFVNKENGRAYLRRFRQTDPCRLEPINGYGYTFEVDIHDSAAMDKWIKFGCVLSKMRSL